MSVAFEQEKTFSVEFLNPIIDETNMDCEVVNIKLGNEIIARAWLCINNFEQWKKLGFTIKEGQDESVCMKMESNMMYRFENDWDRKFLYRLNFSSFQPVFFQKSTTGPYLLVTWKFGKHKQLEIWNEKLKEIETFDKEALKLMKLLHDTCWEKFQSLF